MSAKDKHENRQPHPRRSNSICVAATKDLVGYLENHDVHTLCTCILLHKIQGGDQRTKNRLVILLLPHDVGVGGLRATLAKGGPLRLRHIHPETNYHGTAILVID